MSIKGFYAQKEAKKRGRGKEKGWEKPTFLKEWSRSKQFYSQRPLSQGVTTSSPRNPAKSLQAGNPFSPLNEGDEQLGLQKRDPVQKMEACAKQQELQPSAAQDA